MASADEECQLQPEAVQLPPSPPFQARDDDVLELRPAKSLRPPAPRRATSPGSIPTITTNISSLLPPPHSRPRSPGAKHLRSTSSSSIGSQPLQRAHSSPGVDSTGRFMPTPPAPQRRPASPLSFQGRRRSPLRSAIDDSYPASPSWSNLNLEPNIPEHAELDLGDHFGAQSSPSYASNTFPRSRRRPTSPLHPSASAPVLYHRAVSPASGSTSPSLAAQRYANEPYPGYSFSSASSMPSTPTSLRSRSPSISSLETIEDTPEAEEAAVQEAEEMAKLRAEENDGAADPRRRSSLDSRIGGLRSNKERKRWSVCGAERRADFSLEPIEE